LDISRTPERTKAHSDAHCVSLNVLLRRKAERHAELTPLRSVNVHDGSGTTTSPDPLVAEGAGVPCEAVPVGAADVKIAVVIAPVVTAPVVTTPVVAAVVRTVTDGAKLFVLVKIAAVVSGDNEVTSVPLGPGAVDETCGAAVVAAAVDD